MMDAEELLRDAAARHGIRLAVLVAETGLWASPKVHQRLVLENGTGAWDPTVRRGRLSQGEVRRQSRDGITFDDNSVANRAIKRAIGRPGKSVRGFETCHIWPGTCYDARYHTAIANLVLLPRALAGLSDHDTEIRAILQYRSYELYGWHPEGMPRPTKPQYYPDFWIDPQPYNRTIIEALEARKRNLPMELSASGLASDEGRASEARIEPPAGSRAVPTATADPMTADEHAFVTGRIRRWATRPRSNVHRIVAIVVNAEHGIDRGALVREAKRVTDSRDAYGAVSSLMTSKGNAYGRVFTEHAGIVRIHPEIASEVAKYRWQ
jgi:hypothetical protein